MKNRILFVACFILILLTLSSCQSEKKIVAEPAPTLETVPTEAGTAQTPVPVLDPMPEETLVPSPEPETLGNIGSQNRQASAAQEQLLNMMSASGSSILIM